MNYGVIKSLTFGSYGNLLDYYKNKRIIENTWINKHTYYELFNAGCLGGFMCSFVMTSDDRIKILMQSSKNNNKTFNSTYEMWKELMNF